MVILELLANHSLCFLCQMAILCRQQWYTILREEKSLSRNLFFTSALVLEYSTVDGTLHY